MDQKEAALKTRLKTKEIMENGENELALVIAAGIFKAIESAPEDMTMAHVYGILQLTVRRISEDIYEEYYPKHLRN